MIAEDNSKIGGKCPCKAVPKMFGFYFLLFPKKFNEHYVGKSNIILVVVLILAFLIGFANYYAFDHGLY